MVLMALVLSACASHRFDLQSRMDPLGKNVNARDVASIENESEKTQQGSIETQNFLNVMSFNMWREDNWDRFASMAAAIHDGDAQAPDIETRMLLDVVLLQEVLAQENHTDQSSAHFLGRLLGMHTAFRKRDRGDEGVAVLSRYPIEGIHLKKLFYSQEDPYQRLAIAIEVTHPQWGKTVAISVHLASERENAAIRQKQLEDLKDFIATFREADTLIVGGDFNAFPRDLELLNFSEFWRASKLRPFKQAELFSSPTWANIGLGKDYDSKDAERLDYIFFASNREFDFLGEDLLFRNQVPSSPRVLKSKRQNKIWVSDHLPVLHRFELK